MNRRTIIIAGSLTIVVLLIIGYFLVSGGEPVQTATVTRGDIHEFVDEQAKTRLPKIHQITMPFAGRIKEIEFVEGQRVNAGDPIAQIVQSDLQIAINEARSAVDRYAAAINENQDNSVEDRTRKQSEELANSMVKTAMAAEARLTASKKRLAYATKFRKDIERLFQDKAASENDFERAQVDEVDRQVQFAQDHLIWQATESMRKASDLLPEIIDAYTERKKLSAQVLEKQKAEAQAKLDEMLTRQKRGTMHSPVDGIVLTRMVSNEQFLPAGTQLLEIGEMKKLEVETDVLSQDVGKIRESKRVEIYGGAVGAEVGNGVKGVVHRIYPFAFTKISSLGVEQQRVKVIIRFDDGVLPKLRETYHLGVDFRVRVRIFTDHSSDTLIVPRSALFRGSNDHWEVFVARGRRARRQAVKVGLMNAQQAEIIGGLDEGDTVIVAPESTVKDRTRISSSS